MNAAECRNCGESHGARCPWLHTCQWCGVDVGNYEATAADAKLVHPTRHCETCHAEMVRGVMRDRQTGGV